MQDRTRAEKSNPIGIDLTDDHAAEPFDEEEDKKRFIKTKERSPIHIDKAFYFSRGRDAGGALIRPDSTIEEIANRKTIKEHIEINYSYDGHDAKPYEVQDEEVVLTALGAQITPEQVRAISADVKVIVITEEFSNHYFQPGYKFAEACMLFSCIPSTAEWIVFHADGYYHSLQAEAESHRLFGLSLQREIPAHLAVYVYKLNGWEKVKIGRYQLLRARTLKAEKNLSPNIVMTPDLPTQIADSSDEENEHEIDERVEETEIEIETDIDETIHSNQARTTQLLNKPPHPISADEPADLTLKPAPLRVSTQKRKREALYSDLVNQTIEKYAVLLASHKDNEIEVDTNPISQELLQVTREFYQELHANKKSSKRIATESENQPKKTTEEDTQDCIELAVGATDEVIEGLKNHPLLTNKKITFYTLSAKQHKHVVGDSTDFRRRLRKNFGVPTFFGGKPLFSVEKQIKDPYAHVAYGQDNPPAPPLPTTNTPQSAPKVAPSVSNRATQGRPHLGFNSLGASNLAALSHLPERVEEAIINKRRRK